MKHYCRVVRLRFEMRFIEVDAIDHGDAEEKAVQEARTPSRAWRLVKYDQESYAPHVEVCVSEEDVNHSAGDEELATLASVEPLDEVAYLLLMGDPESGSGEIVWEPWFSGISTLMAADICQDWADNLIWIAPEDPFASMGPEPRAIIIPFRKSWRPETPDDDPDDPAA